MRFLTRSLVGLFLFAMTLGLIALSIATIRDAMIARNAESAGRPPGSERVFAVGVETLSERDVQPVLTAYGDVTSAVRLELRAASEGTVLELSPGFRDGGQVRAGEILFRLDPAEFETELALAENDLADTRAELADARIEVELAEESLGAAERQRDLQSRALDRARDLQGRGVSTTADLETSELALSSAEQIVTSRRLDLAQAKARVGRAGIAESRAVIARDEAARDLDNTIAIAPFDGLLSEVDAVLGRRASVNETLGILIDPAALEVAFRVSNADYARLSDRNGVPLPLEVRATLDLGTRSFEASGTIDRAGAALETGQTGRLLYAALATEVSGLLRPGDFVTVHITEPALAKVAVVPATALNAQAELLLLGDDDRLELTTVRILRRQGDDVIIEDAPFGREYVTVRIPQLGPGIRVRPIRPDAYAAEEAAVDPREAMVALSPEERARLAAAIEGEAGLSAEMKARLLSVLATGQVPRQVLDEIEAGLRGG